MNLRGLFGSSARQATPFVEPDQGGGFMPAPAAPSPAIEAATGAPGGPAVRSYFGGLVKYQRPEGMTGARRMELAGATMADVAAALGGGQGGGLSRVQERYREEQKRSKMSEMMGKLYPDDPEAAAMLDIDPSALSRAWLESKKPVEWDTVEGDDGLYLVNPRSGESKKVQSWQRKAPSGWEWGEEGLQPIKNGPYDPAYIGTAAGVRRDAVVKRPMPSRARAGGGGAAASTGLPPGYRPRGK